MKNYFNAYCSKNSLLKLIKSLMLVATLTLTYQANAGLIARTITVTSGSDVEAYYDDVLDLTWLKDANYAKTSGYDADGLMTWDNTNTWASNLLIGDYSDWRLPTVTASDSVGGFDYKKNDDGSSDRGYNITSITHEMAYMVNVNLGLESYYNVDGSVNSNWVTPISHTGIDTISLGNNIDIDNLMSYVYWSGSEYAPNTERAWFFRIYSGYQDFNYKNSNLYGWAVRDGDVGAATNPNVDVPEPTTFAIFGLGLLGLMVRRNTF